MLSTCKVDRQISPVMIIIWPNTLKGTTKASNVDLSRRNTEQLKSTTSIQPSLPFESHPPPPPCPKEMMLIDLWDPVEMAPAEQKGTGSY